MKNCSFCGKPTRHYRTSAKDPWTVQHHCQRLWCIFTHWLALQWHNYAGRFRNGNP